jgi:CheY-like chemotaxis protein
MNGDLGYTPYICAATAYTLDSFRQKAISNGMDRYLTKPITIMDIEEVLRDLALI